MNILDQYEVKEEAPLKIYYFVMTIMIPGNLIMVVYEIIKLFTSKPNNYSVFAAIDAFFVVLLVLSIIGLYTFKKIGYYSITTLLILSLVMTVWNVLSIENIQMINLIIGIVQPVLLILYYYKRKKLFN